MLRAMRWICGSLILAGFLGTAALAPAQNKNDPPREVIDDAHLFKKETIREANADIAEIKRAYRKDVLVETRKEGVPKNEYRQWAQKRAKDYRVNGIYIVITLEPDKHLDVLVGNATLKSGDFTEANRKEAQALLLKEFLKDHDKALLDALKYIRTAFRDNTAPKAGAAAPPPVGVQPEPGGHNEPVAAQSRHGWSFLGLGIGGFICLALIAVVVIWVVIGIVRALTAPRYPVGGPPGGGYGGGYGPGYGGIGGGGGFFSSLLGGMFGAAAGMWMYNSFFGGHSNGAGPTHTSAGFGGGDYYGGNANPNPEAQPNDVASGYSGDAGGDWGDGDKEDAGGGDAGGDAGGGDAGGGDWGGGDAGGGDGGGGGGDWGGGDAGGGGGDWGGGGDAGGGGGGGDW